MQSVKLRRPAEMQLVVSVSHGKSIALFILYAIVDAVSSSMRKEEFTGSSGNKYSYWRTPIEQTKGHKTKPGNYIFAKKLSDGTWQALYIGETHSFEHLPQGKIVACIRRQGATHIFSHLSEGDDPDTRRAEVQDLVKELHPPCNLELEKIQSYGADSSKTVNGLTENAQD